jgi:hypothetical protein
LRSRRNILNGKLGQVWAILSKSLIVGNYSSSLECAVENAIIVAQSPNLIPARGKPAVKMNDNDEGALREQLARLQQEHRDLDAAIAALAVSPGSDLIQVQRLKKRKLVLRDKIRQIEDALTPDIIA